MKKSFLEKLLDLIYDYIDYIIMIVIIILVVGLIAWRLDLIFTDNGTSSQPPIEEVEEEREIDEQESQVPEETEETSPEDTDDPNGETDDPDPEGDMGMEVEIEIPSGTMPPGIGNILLENNLIEDSSEFLSAVEAENLETRLKAGVYIIPSGSDINEILQILTN